MAGQGMTTSRLMAEEYGGKTLGGPELVLLLELLSRPSLVDESQAVLRMSSQVAGRVWHEFAPTWCICGAGNVIGDMYGPHERRSTSDDEKLMA